MNRSHFYRVHIIVISVIFLISIVTPDETLSQDINIEGEEEVEEGYEEEMEVTPLETRKTLDDFKKRIRQLTPSEKLEAWQEYLRKYPDTIFIKEIKEEIKRIEEELYSDITEEEALIPVIDAAKQEIDLTEPLTFTSPNTRKKFYGGFEYGVPGYFAGGIAFEYAFARQFSLDTSLWYPGDGLAFRVVPKYAFVKTKKYDVIISAGAGAWLYISPISMKVPVYIGFGKIFSEKFDLQALLSTTLAYTPELDYPLTLSLGGYYHMSDKWTFALESNNWLKTESMGAFMTVTGGAKYTPIKNLDINLGISAPYYYRYYNKYTIDIILNFVLRM